MLARSQGDRLCSRCRFDLLSFFQRGFCDTKRAFRPRPSSSTKSFSSRSQRRPFNFSAAAFQQESAKSTINTPEDGGPTTLQRSHLTDDQLAALRDLEAVLGRPIDDAIEEDKFQALIAEAEEKLQSELEDDVEEIDAEEDDIEEPDDGEAVQHELTDESIVALRSAGASASDVAREARQVFSEYLPEDLLQEDETMIYRRMYGDPFPEIEYEVPEEHPDAEEETPSRGELVDRRGKPIKTDVQGSEAVAEDLDEPAETHQNDSQNLAIDIAESLGGIYAEEEPVVQDEEEGQPLDRFHPLTALGKAGTRPSTINLPKDKFADALQNIMAGYSNKQLQDTSERTFGGPGLPDSPLTPRSGRSRKQVPVSLQASQIFMGEMEANAFLTAVMPPAYAAITSVLTETRKRLGQTWLTELLARPGGPRVLDAGAGGAGILAWNEIIKAHWQALHSSDTNPPPPPPSKTVVLTGSDPLRHRSAAMLENTTFIPRLPDYIHTRNRPTLDDERSTQQRKEFDVVISAYSLLPFEEDWEKKQYVQNLWTLLSPKGGILILIEKGMPRGFEAIAGARDMLLERYIATPSGHNTHYTLRYQNEEDSVHERLSSMIVAPCTNHEKCPMYRIPGEAQGRKDFCSFQQRYIRPPQLQRVLGAKDRNHDDVDFSYVSVMKGRDLREHQFSNWNHLSDPLSSPKSTSGSQAQSQSNTETWLGACKTGFGAIIPESVTDTSSLEASLAPTHLLPRLVLSPIKRQGHILLDVCTPSGTLERWTVPRSFSKQAFRDARKAQWGDIWAMGAKTRIPRKVRVGGPDSKENRAARDKDERQRERDLNILDSIQQEKELQGSAQARRGRALDRFDEEEDEEEDDEDDEVSNDVMNQVWQDIGVSQLERQADTHTDVVKEKISTPRQPPRLKPSRTRPHQSHGPRDVEDDATRQMMEEWEAEFNPSALTKNKKGLSDRSSTKVTRTSKRKYREVKRDGTHGQEER